MEKAMSNMSLNSGTRPKLDTNVYKIRNDTRAIHRYTVTIEKIIRKENKQEKVELSRAGGQDAIRVPRSRLCCAVIKQFSCELNDTVVLYEGCAVLFANNEIPTIAREIPANEVMKLVSEWDYKLVMRDATSLIFKIVCDQGLIDITSLVKKCEEDNQPIVDFLATLCRAEAPTNRFVAFRGGKLMDNNSIKNIPFGHMRGAGISMGVRAVKNERDGNSPIMALDIDVTEGTFYKPQPLAASVCEFFGFTGQLDKLKRNYSNREVMRDVEKYVRDIPVVYDRTEKVFTVTGLKWDENHNGIALWSTAMCKDEAEAQAYEGSAVCIEEYKGGDGKTRQRFYPMDGLRVLPYTRVPKEKQKGGKPRPQLPPQRYNGIQQGRKDLKLDYQNDTLREFGTEIATEPVRVDQKRLDAPRMMGSSAGILREIRVDPVKHSWNDEAYKFMRGAKIDELFVSFQAETLSGQQAGDFAKAHVAACRSKGMEIGKFNGTPLSSLAHLEENLAAFATYRAEQRAKEGQAGFRAFYILLAQKEWHDHLKYLEQRHALSTQHVDSENVKKMCANNCKRGSTLLNIVRKTNVKAGGDNFKIGELEGNSLFPSPDPNSPVTLIVGLDVAHPAPQTRHQIMRGMPVDPSCIGISSNCMMENPQAFTGYEVYTESRKEAATDKIMYEAGAHLIQKFFENQKRFPTNVVYFRDGVDKGQYCRVKEEFKAMMDGMREHIVSKFGWEPEDFTPREVIILGTKRHNVRAFEVKGGVVQNCKAGTIIDSGIVTPYYPEFFLFASHALIGTAKPVQCTILRDTSEENLKSYPGAKLYDMEKFVHALAFGHQICEMPTSLPEPLYNAHETAKRGSANFKTDRNNCAVREGLTPEELTEKLSNRDSELGCIKFNA